MNRDILYKGPDLSYHNGNVDMEAVKSAGCTMLMLRSGYGNNNIDKKFDNNAVAAMKAGLPVGTYWFSYALNTDMAAQEGKHAVAAAARYFKKCPVAFDLEYDSVKYAGEKGVVIGRREAMAFAAAFLTEVINAGFIPLLYTNEDFWRNYFDIESLQKMLQGKLYIWYARYSKSIPDSRRAQAAMWQYTSSAVLNGVNSRIDMNEVYEDIFLDKNEISVPEAINNKIADFQRSANDDGYRDYEGKKLDVDGRDGKRTESVRRQVVLKAERNEAGDAVWSKKSRGELVKWWQKQLQASVKPQISIDGMFGNETREGTVEFQRKYLLEQDGIAGYQTITKAIYQE